MSGGEAEGSKDAGQPQESISRSGLVKPGPRGELRHPLNLAPVQERLSGLRLA